MSERTPTIWYNPDTRRIEGDTSNSEAVQLFLASTFWVFIEEHQKQFFDLPMLKGVSRVIFGSTNEHKLRGFNRLMANVRRVLKGDHQLVLQQGFESKTIKPKGDEPAANEAILVAIDKVRRAVQALKTNRRCKNRGCPTGATREGGPAVVYATDVVIGVKKNGVTEHMLNLSRTLDEAGGASKSLIDDQVRTLQSAYSEGPTVIEYQVAAAISRKNGGKPKEVATGIVVRLHFDEIPEKEVETVFKKSIPGVFGMNAGLPLVDGPMLKYLRRIEVAPLGRFVNTYNSEDSGKLLAEETDSLEFIGCNLEELTIEKQNELFESLKIWVVEALPPSAMALFMGGTKTSIKSGVIEVV